MSTKNQSTWEEYKGVFTNKNYMLLWIGQTISQIGNIIAVIAIPLLIYELTNSALDMTFAFAIEAIPWIIIGPIAGVWVDRISRRYIIILMDYMRMILILSIFFIDHVYLIYLITFLSQVMASIFLPAWSATIPELTGKKYYVKAIGLSYTSWQIVQVCAPILAATLIGLTGNIHSLFLYDSSTFFIAATLALFIKFPEKGEKQEENTLRTFKQSFAEGIRFLFKTDMLRYLVSVSMLKQVVQSFFIVGSLLYAKTILNLSDTQSDQFYGILLALNGVGTIVGTIFIGIFEKKLNRQMLIHYGLILQGVAYLFIFFQPGPILLGVIYIIAGLAASGAITPVSTGMAETTPNEIRGRVYSAANSIFRTTSMVFYMLAGIIGEFGGALLLMMVTALVLIVITPLLTFVGKVKIHQPVSETIQKS